MIQVKAIYTNDKIVLNKSYQDGTSLETIVQNLRDEPGAGIPNVTIVSTSHPNDEEFNGTWFLGKDYFEHYGSYKNLIEHISDFLQNEEDDEKVKKVFEMVCGPEPVKLPDADVYGWNLSDV